MTIMYSNNTMSNRKCCLLLVLLAVLLGSQQQYVISILHSREEYGYGNIYYVTPSENGSCPGQNFRCKPLSEYLENNELVVNSDSLVLFLPGVHIFNDTVKVIGVSNVTLQGSLGDKSAIFLRCLQNQRGGFFVQNVSNLAIKELNIVNCTAYKSTAIWIKYGANILISQAIVSNVYYGVYIENTVQNVSILHSTLEAHYTNLWLVFELGVSECNGTSEKQINTNEGMLNVTILGVHISGGQRGLSVKHNQPCYHSNILMRDLVTEGGYPGGNMYIDIKEFQQVSYSLRIENSVFARGISHTSGGGISVTVDTNYADSCSQLLGELPSNLILISDTSIVDNKANSLGGGLYAKFNSLCRSTNVTLSNVTFSSNTVVNTGSNLAIDETISRSFGEVKYNITDCTFRNGSGPGASTWFSVSYSYDDVEYHSSDKVEIRNTIFANNSASGGSLSFLVSSVHHLNTRINVLLQNSTFIQNQGLQQGSAISLLGGYPQVMYNFTLKDATIEEQLSQSPIAEVGSVYIEATYQVNIANTSFIDNKGTALFVFNSIVAFQGTVLFEGNSGYNGGAIALCGASYIHFNNNSEVLFLGNHAEHVGGAIYVQDNCFLSGNTYCFYRLLPAGLNSKVNTVFVGNTAKAGEAIYGGQVATCSDPIDGRNHFEDLFGSLVLLSTQCCSSKVSSSPERVRFCSQNGCPLDSRFSKAAISTYPGKNFSVSLAIVGQMDGLVPGAVHADISQLGGEATIDGLQNLQTIAGNCTIVFYRLFADTGSTTILTLYAEQPNGLYVDTSETFHQNKPNISIEVILEQCPPAFSSAVDELNRTICDCEPQLKQHNVHCDIEEETIQPPAGVWIGYHNASNHTLLHSFCPVSYCKETYKAMKVVDLDDQCYSNRSGVLCGECRKGYSMVFGSSGCKQCSHAYISLVAVFALCGVVLVASLRITHITVSDATVNGLIFYANIVHANHGIFFHRNSNFFSKILSVFLAWLNLDLGVKTCFYDGMDSYAKTWLQYLFPLYIWVIMVTMVTIGYYKTGNLTRLIVGHNGVQVLATLFLLSYTKLQRIVISSLHFTTISYPGGYKKAVWLQDGNVQYLHRKHIPLFIAALLTLTFLIVPFTLLVTFAQWIQKFLNYFRPGRVSNTRLWVFHDAYSGKYKDIYRFWTGILLITRTGLLLIFAFNVAGDPTVNLLTIGLTSSCLLVIFTSASGGMYKQKVLNVLESSFLFNLLFLSLCSLYLQQSNEALANVADKQEIVTDISLGIAFLTFVGVLLYHLIQYPFRHLYDYFRQKKTSYKYQQHTGTTVTEGVDLTANDNEEYEEVSSVEYVFNNSGELELISQTGSDNQ